MKILFVGDVYGRPGRRAAAHLIPQLIAQHAIDFCVVNGENSAGGFGITAKIGQKFHAYGADVITMGDHVWDQKDSVGYISNRRPDFTCSQLPQRGWRCWCSGFFSAQWNIGCSTQSAWANIYENGFGLSL